MTKGLSGLGPFLSRIWFATWLAAPISASAC